MNAVFETPRLLFRRFSADDAALLFDLDSDPAVMRYLTGGPGTPLDSIRDRILPAFMTYAEPDDGHGAWATHLRESSEFIGWFSLRRSDADARRGSEVGYRLRQAVWGRGLATEGLEALVRRAFETGGTHRAFGTTYEGNTGSRRVMEKAGMRHVRSFRLTSQDLAASPTVEPTGGDPWDGDDVEYAITRAEWAARARIVDGLMV